MSWVADSNPQVLAVLEYQLTRSLALALDLGFFEGTGTAPQIRGLKNTPGIQTISMGTNGAAVLNFDVIAQALSLLATANAPGPFAIVMRPEVMGRHDENQGAGRQHQADA
ncbi:MAG: phage major capsid protein [Solirubrobacteraceae bacterium]